MMIAEVQHLVKRYPSFELSDVSFSLEGGKITGFVGRNGAGKTTTIKAMLNLIRLNERFVVNGEPVSDAVLEAVARRVVAVVEAYEAEHGAEVTFFECLTAVAFLLFREVGVKLAVLETGLGGRLDATNVVTPLGRMHETLPQWRTLLLQRGAGSGLLA